MAYLYGGSQIVSSYDNGHSWDNGVYGGNGDDSIYLAGGANYGFANGGDGDDLIDARQANDTRILAGAYGQDRIWGSPGNDNIYGDEGNDFLEGGEGNDNIHGGLDDDNLLGKEGDDTLRGDPGNDTIEPGEGKDIAIGGGGNDTFYASTGNDVFYGGSSTETKTNNDEIDRLILSGKSSEYIVSRATDITFGYVYYIQDKKDGSPDGLDTLYEIDKLRFSDGDFNLATYYSNQERGRTGDDELTGTSGDDLIDGFGGNDTITGLAGDDILIGGDGDDEIDGGSGTNRIYGDAGDDTIISSGTNDVVDAGAGNNNITISSTANSGQYTSGDGNDIYKIQEGASGNVTITSGDGIDEFVVNSSNLININIYANGNGVKTLNLNQGHLRRFDSGSGRQWDRENHVIAGMVSICQPSMVANFTGPPFTRHDRARRIGPATSDFVSAIIDD